MVCHSGVRLTPIIDGQIRNFSAGGLYNGLVLMIDDETHTYWDHVTGEAVHGPDAGKQMAFDSLGITTLAAERARRRGTQLLRSGPSLVRKFMGD